MHPSQSITTMPVEGVVSLMLTPFNEDGSIAWQTYARYTEWQAAKQSSGLFAVCGSSEMKWLTQDERLRLITETVKYANGLPVVATANLDPDPNKHIDDARRIEDLGVSALVLVPPFHVSADSDRYFDYLSQMRQRLTRPIIVYEWPQVDNYVMDIVLFQRLVENQIINGIKDTTCTIDGIASKQRIAGDTIIYQANTPYLVEALNRGVRGIMAITSTCKADLVKAFWQAYPRDERTAAALHRELVYLDMVLRLAYPASAKYIMRLQGLEMTMHTRWDVQLLPEMAKAIDIWFEQYRIY